MATRFGAVSPAHTYAAKVRWLVGCLVVVILVLAVAIVFIAQTEGTESTQTNVLVTTPVPPEDQQKTIDVLVAATRIEEGTKLEQYMFKSLPMDSDQLPMAVIRTRDSASVYGKYAGRLVNANMPLVMEDVAPERPITSFNIPPGYRAATITVDARTGVEGFAKPNSRVDVLWTYTQDAKKKVATIARFVKVLSVGGSVAGNTDRAAVAQATTVTLLVTEKDAKKIELARSLGELSLSLVGEHENPQSANEPDAITILDLIGKPAEQQQAEPAEVAHDGVMYTSDPHTGRQIRYVLVNGRWALDRSFGGE
jgi:pilus assembly protein CpaB